MKYASLRRKGLGKKAAARIASDKPTSKSRKRKTR